MTEGSEDYCKRRSNCRADGTSFGINFQLERSNGGYVFDGADFGSQTVPITFRGPIKINAVSVCSFGF